jgi:hypothetical protein
MRGRAGAPTSGRSRRRAGRATGGTRQFPITERIKLDFSAEAFNVANAVIFGGPASPDINNANFGRITGQQNSARSIQLALKLNF